MLNALFLAKGFHRQFSLSAIDRLEGTWFVVNSGMQDTGIVSGLVLGERVLLVQHRDQKFWMFLAEPVSRRQAHDTASYYANIVLQASSNRS